MPLIYSTEKSMKELGDKVGTIACVSIFFLPLPPLIRADHF
jgi:hypothetical protein